MNVTQIYGEPQAAAARALIGGDVIGDVRNTLLKQVLVAVANKTSGGGGTGDVVGPASSTDGAVTLWDGITGKLIKDSSVFITGGGTVALGGFTLTVPANGTAALRNTSNIFTVNGAASTPAMALNGSIFTGGSATSTKPQFLIEPSGTTSTGWNTAGTLLGLNAPSGFAGNLLDLQLNGSSKCSVTAGGLLSSTGFNLTTAGATPNFGMAYDGASMLFYAGSSICIAIYDTEFIFRSSQQMLWSQDATYSSPRDTGILRSAAALVKVSDGGAGYGTIDALGLKASGVAGANFSGLLTSITVVNGIVTAAS